MRGPETAIGTNGKAGRHGAFAGGGRGGSPSGRLLDLGHVSTSGIRPVAPKGLSHRVPGGFNWPIWPIWPIWVTQEHGHFAKNGIEVTLTNTPNSVFQLTNLMDGKFDIAVTAIDNVIAYNEGQGEVPVAATPELFAFMAGDNGLLSLASVPEVKTYADLKGRSLSVDAMTTGYAFVLFDMLRRHRLNRGDSRVEKAGGVLARWQALQAHQHEARCC
jgi:ABC-type nitrate/sulfonate/bicarbonate transport system substrate-binding protein